ncbi:MAG: hypothetical protein H8E17_03175 [Deltaproteobacteria bacterium]|nr:hypothetical protein [Deltaproteobacteria bacterium]
MDNEPDETDSHDDGFTAKDAFFVGSIVGNAYEEGLDERRRRELLRKKTKKNKPSLI